MSHFQFSIFNFQFVLALLFCLVATSVSAQRTRTVQAIGSYVASEHETAAFGRAQALQNAKKEALREAGVMEDVQSTAIVVMGNNNNQFYEISSELGRIELDGKVRVIAKTDIKPEYLQDNLTKYTVAIKAEVVIEDSQEDLNFRIAVDGFQNTYLEDENLQFTITPTKDCYIRVFFFGKYSNSQIFPMNGIFKDVQLKAGNAITFPPEDNEFLFNKPFEYTLQIDDQKQFLEQDVILIVALKKNYPFVDDVSYESVISWLSKIKKSEKCTLWQGINVVKKN